MASTGIRWMNLMDVRFRYTSGTICLDDCLGGSSKTTTQMIGSNSENDSFANHFVQGIKIADEMQMRSYDIARAVALREHRGEVGSAYMKIPIASQSYKDTGHGSTTKGIVICTSACTGAGAMITDISITADKDGEAVAEISIIFRSTTSGQNSGMVTSFV